MARPSLTSSWWALAAGPLAVAALGWSLTIRFAFPWSVPCAIAALWIATRRARAALPIDPDAAFVHALVASSVASFLAFGIYVVHAGPTWVHAAWYDEDPFFYSEIFTVPTMCLIGLPLVVGVAEVLIARSTDRLRLVVRRAVAPLAALVTALALLGCARHLTHPQPTRSFARFPVVASFDRAGREASTTDHRVGDLTLTVGCVQRRCSVLLRPTAWASRYGQLPTVWPDDPLLVRRDARHDLWIIQTPGHARYSHTRSVGAFRGPALERVAVSLTDLPGDFAPPLGWSLAALLGVALAGWFARRARSADAIPPGLVDATLAADGGLRLGDGTALVAPPDAGFAPGPVVVDAPPLAAASYRDPATARIVREGTLARWSASLRDARDVRLALAFSALVLLGTPIAMAACLRLLG